MEGEKARKRLSFTTQRTARSAFPRRRSSVSLSLSEDELS